MSRNVVTVNLPSANKLDHPYCADELKTLLDDFETQIEEIEKKIKSLGTGEKLTIEIQWIYPNDVRMIFGKTHSDDINETLRFLKEKANEKKTDIDFLMRNSTQDHVYDSIIKTYERVLSIIEKKLKNF